MSLRLLASRLFDQVLKSKACLRLALNLVNSIVYRSTQMQAALAAKISPDDLIRGGPFKGMVYPYNPAKTSSMLPKFLGSYEQELHPYLEACFQRTYAVVINIGAGEGYYAVGAALRLPNTRVIAYEMEPILVKLCRETANKNGVADRLEVRGKCNPDDLRSLAISGRCLILCDCEGAEYSLLDPASLPAEQCDLLIELHDAPPALARQPILQERFSATHKITEIQGRVREPSDYPILDGLTSGEKWLAVNEFRPILMTWLYLEAR